MDRREEIEKAMKLLQEWAIALCLCAGETEKDGVDFWNTLIQYPDILQEFAYYYDNQDFLCKFEVEGLTIADILVWQMDHFKAHMDRADSANRYDKDKLVLSTFRTMIALKQDPIRISREFAAETGTDLAGGWNLH